MYALTVVAVGLQSWVNVFSGHSMRHFLPSVTAALGASKDRRDYLGRWHIHLHQSSDYVHTAKQNVHSLQQEVCQGLSFPQGPQSYDEDELLEQMETFLKSRGADLKEVDGHRTLKLVNGLACLNQGWPIVSAAGEAGEMEDATQSSSPADMSGSSVSPYWVSISRHSGHRRLHARGKCWVTPWSCAGIQEVWRVSPEVADSHCKLCLHNLKLESFPADTSSSVFQRRGRLMIEVRETTWMVARWW